MSKTVPLDGNSAARSLYYYVTCGLLGRCRIQVVQASSTGGAGCAPGVSRLSGVPLGRGHVPGDRRLLGSLSGGTRCCFHKGSMVTPRSAVGVHPPPV